MFSVLFPNAPLQMTSLRPSYKRLFDAALVCCSMLVVLSVGAASPIAGQVPTAGQEMPVPLVVSGVPAPDSLQWDHYVLLEQCYAAFGRAVVPASLPLDRDTLRDTVRGGNPWTPLPPTAIHEGRHCLDHFRVNRLPAFVLPIALRLAVAVNADSIVQAIVARQLTGAHEATARAAVLDSTVDILLSNNWNNLPEDWHLTAVHVQMARMYLAQLDALGTAALWPRIRGREALLKPAQYTDDLPAKLAIQQEIQQVLVHVPIAEVPEPERNKFRLYQQLNKVRLSELTYEQSFSHDDLNKYLQERAQLHTLWSVADLPPAMIGKSAPPVTCDYTFNTPAEGPVPMPVMGKVTVIVFGNYVNNFGFHLYGQDLRRLHTKLPDVAITTIISTGGAVGNEFFGGRSQQEAEHIHWLVTDSMKAPGAVCVQKSEYDTLPNGKGHVTPLFGPVYNDYGINGLPVMFIVDSTGVVVFESETDDQPFEDDVVDFVRRLRSKVASGANTAGK